MRILQRIRAVLAWTLGPTSSKDAIASEEDSPLLPHTFEAPLPGFYIQAEQPTRADQRRTLAREQAERINRALEERGVRLADYVATFAEQVGEAAPGQPGGELQPNILGEVFQAALTGGPMPEVPSKEPPSD